ncbi:MAG: STAS domain-containing protein [Solirubrobacterales bacterium]|nr:STAS domain-containing protein [Solirubrobacterales bacterium]
MAIPPIGLDLREREHEGVHTLSLGGELDIASVPALNAAVNRLSPDRTQAVRIDLSRLKFMDSTGLAAIVHASKVCEQHEYRFSLVPGSPAVQRLFELTGLIDVLPFESLDAGVQDSAAEQA